MVIKGWEEKQTRVGGDTGEPPRDREPRVDHVWEMIEQHAEDYLLEGERLLRTLRRMILFVGVAVALAGVGLVAVVAFALLR